MRLKKLYGPILKQLIVDFGEHIGKVIEHDSDSFHHGEGRMHPDDFRLIFEIL